MQLYNIYNGQTTLGFDVVFISSSQQILAQYLDCTNTPSIFFVIYN
jgi:hypothetical protein